MNKTIFAWIAAGVLTVGLALSAGAANAEPKLLWETEGLDRPESVLLDDTADVLYVSNVNGSPTEPNGKGYIAKLSPDGKILEKEWVSGLNAPKGLGLRNGTLYATDIDKLVEIDTKTGKLLKTHNARGAKFLNDIAVHKDGRVFVSDMLDNKIWVLEDGAFSVWVDDAALENPNGLLAEDGRLIVGSWGVPKDDFSTDVPGTLTAIDYTTKKIEKLGGKPVGNLDGVEPDGKGSYLVTDWLAGALYRIAPDGSFEELLDLNKGSADLTVIENGTQAIIPMMLDNKVVAYTLP